jgi:hypothetical protein
VANKSVKPKPLRGSAYSSFSSNQSSGEPMKTLVLALCVVFTTAGCNQPPAQQAAAAASDRQSTSTSADSPVQFELRDFRLDKESSDVGPSYKGRGTIVTKDPRLASGSYFLFLSAKQAHNNDEEQKIQVLLTDGIGTVETFDFFPSADKDKVVKYYEWRVIGYVPLLQGRMNNPADTKPASQS